MAVDIVHSFDAGAGAVRALEVERYDALILREHPSARPRRGGTAAGRRMVVADPRRRRRAPAATCAVCRSRDRYRVRGARAAHGRRLLADVELTRGLPADVLRTLDARRRHAAVSQRAIGSAGVLEDGRVKASVKLQDVFGLVATPRRPAPRARSVRAPGAEWPAGAVDADLRSFWDRTYPEVRKELRGRYPKHRWPEKVV